MHVPPAAQAWRDARAAAAAAGARGGPAAGPKGGGGGGGGGGTAPAAAAGGAGPFVFEEGDLPHTRIGDILKTKRDPALWICGSSMVIDALRMMRDHNEAALLVFDPAKAERQDEFPRSADACAGILTERDHLPWWDLSTYYLRKVVLVGRGSFTTPVADIMTPRSRAHG
ncbi:MAG: hypothetical protein J3K34DRAFT_464344 [Monoraphidium minutum]|nr:MAG: hypothetical protein J3K34DRAFT_464344 [Monoraphidium minutum]